ncbi:MAG: hypothetical protein PHV02_21115, partial [Rhodocyclaceae bacterium]|nr:hypothetical protein [Rhodocyclaceae bacterium]
TLMADGAVDASELKLIESNNMISRLGMNLSQFDRIFYEFCEDMLTSADRHSSGRLELDKETINRLFDEIRDPLLQKKAIRFMIDIVNADHCLSASEALLIAQALERWELDLCEVSDSTLSYHHGAAVAPRHSHLDS